jgi:uncharacterized membrane protein SpoIIM required for sporulation
MRVADRLAQREATWRELDLLLLKLESQRLRKAKAAEILRLGELYRAACADLMLAEAHDLPRDTIAFLHALVARAHNATYRAQGFRFADWASELFQAVPRRLRSDPTLRLSALIFYGVFLIFALLGAGRPRFAEQVVGESMLTQMEQMYDRPLSERQERSDAAMAGFYIQHNAGIGLKCYAWGLLLGLGTLYQLIFNGAITGAIFGHMVTTPQASNFYQFVTAHAPFELTALVFSGAAGLRLGWGLIETHGQSRLASLRREALASLPTAGAAVFLFVLAAFLEGFVSASSMPYWGKAAIATLSAALILVYLMLGGRGGGLRLQDQAWVVPSSAPLPPTAEARLRKAAHRSGSGGAGLRQGDPLAGGGGLSLSASPQVGEGGSGAARGKTRLGIVSN